MDARSKYLARKNTPTPFSQGPEMKNYTRMMELQSQAPNFTANDPRFDELKAARRQYNREDKYKIGEKFNITPLDVQNQFMDQTNVFRNAAPNVYRKMYPFSDLAMRYGESGGLLGMMAKEMFGKVKDIGSNITDKIGITGAVDSDEKEMDDYAARTFGFGAPTFPGSEITIPYPHQDYPDDVVTEVDLPPQQVWNERNTPINLEEVLLKDYKGGEGAAGQKIPNPPGYPLESPYPDVEVPTPEFQGLAPTPDIIEPLPFDEGREDYIRRQNEYRVAPLGSPDPHGDFPITYPQDKPINWDLENNKYYQDLTPEEIDYIFGRKDEIADEEMNIPPPIIPFDDSGREAGIASLYGQGPQYATNNRRYENEYRDFIANMSDTLRQFGPLTYEEFADMYEKMYQGKPHTGFIYQSPASMR